jgi:hypothetical protein
MTDTIISNEETSQAAAPPPAAAPAIDAADLQRQIAELKEQIAESNRTAEFWAEQARGNTPAPQTPDNPEPDEDEDEDPLEAITSGGSKGFDKLAEKRGFVKRDQVVEMIESRASGLVKEQELLTRYPDLKNRSSDFFKTTAAHYGALVKGGTPPNVAMELASEKAELDFMRAGKITPDGNGTTAADREKDRRARISAQSGGGGPRRPAAEETEDDTLTPEQKRIAAGMGISEEAYLKRAKAGVRMGGKPNR